MSIFRELKRRNVFRVGLAYAVAAWVLLQIFDVIGDILELPAWGGKLILAMLIVAVFVLAACGGAATPTEMPIEPTALPAQPTSAPVEEMMGEVQLPEVDPLVLTGNIVIAGSSTVFPLSERMAERFEDEGYAGEITIETEEATITVRLQRGR